MEQGNFKPRPLDITGMIPTALAYILYILGLRTTSATVSSIVTLLEPLTATTLGLLLFGERLGTLGFAGAALLLGALLLTIRVAVDEGSGGD